MASKFETWARAYRRAAKANGYAKIIGWLAEQGHVEPETLCAKAVKDTVELVSLVIQPGDPEGLLPLQVYDPEAARARYVLSFQGGGHDLVRLYCDDISKIDLVDLYDSAVGFAILTVTLTTAGEFAPGEGVRLEEQIRNDFCEDYGEDEIHLTFEQGKGWVQVEVVEPD